MIHFSVKCVFFSVFALLTETFLWKLHVMDLLLGLIFLIH